MNLASLDTLGVIAIIVGGFGTPLAIWFAARRLEAVVERHGTGRCRTKGE